jgi:hypothetical protein
VVQVPSEEMTITPVSTYVNKVTNEGPECIREVVPPKPPAPEPAQPKVVQAELF